MLLLFTAFLFLFFLFFFFSSQLFIVLVFTAFTFSSQKLILNESETSNLWAPSTSGAAQAGGR